MGGDGGLRREAGGRLCNFLARPPEDGFVVSWLGLRVSWHSSTCEEKLISCIIWLAVLVGMDNQIPVTIGG